MLLDGRTAIVYGGGGQIGGAVARAFAREGAHVHLAGRTAAPLEAVADAIRSGGGRADTAVVDALDETAVDAHADAVAAGSGRLDISCNLISKGDVQGTALAEMSVDDFVGPVDIAVRSQFLTMRAAARHMVPQRAGVILTIGGAVEPLRDYATGGHQIFMGGTKVAFGAVDVLRNQFACELGPYGIRVVNLQSAGFPETIAEEWREMIGSGLVAASMLKRPETLEDAGNLAAFLASDQARLITAAAINMTAGRDVS